MIDNIKVFIQDKIEFEESAHKNDKIDLMSKINTFTGELLEYPKRGKLQNLNINITNKSSILYGSVHKYYNLSQGLKAQNYNDFSFCQFNEVVKSLEMELVFNPAKTKITNLEFGFNLVVDEDPQSIIDNKLLMYNYKSHNRNQKFKATGDFKEFQLTDYSLKIYNKSKQYKILERNIIRFELKITNSRLLKKLEIVSYSDLNRSAFSKLFEAFLNYFDKLIIVDSITPPEALQMNEKAFFNKYTNPIHWEALDASNGYRGIYKIQDKFNRILKDYSLLKTKSLLRERIISKYTELIDCDSNRNFLLSVA